MGSLNWLTIAFIIAAGQGLLLIAGLSRPAGRSSTAHSYLLVLIGSVVISLLLRLTYTEGNQVFLIFPQLSLAGDFVLFVIGPALFLYVKSLLDPSFQGRPQDGWHFVPLGLFGLSYAFWWGMGKEYLLKSHIDGSIYPYYIIMMTVGILQIGTYAFLGLKKVYKFTRVANGQNKKVNARLPYLRIVLYSTLGVAICWIPGHIHFFWSDFNLGISNFFYQLSFLILSLLIFTIGYFALRSPEILLQKSMFIRNKYRHSSLDKASAFRIKDRLIQLLEHKKPYLDPRLSLKDLANQLEINQVYLSQVINEQCGKNFYELINEYRVRAFIENAQSEAYKNFTLLAIAMDSGFQSKTSFNKAFKKVTGLTPRQYLRQAPA